MNRSEISVLVIERQPLMRAEMCTVIAIERGLKVAAEVADGAEALCVAEAVQPDILLLALESPAPGDMDALIALHRAFPALPILALTTNEQPDQQATALTCGAQAVLSKAASRLELVGKLRGMTKETAS